MFMSSVASARKGMMQKLNSEFWKRKLFGYVALSPGGLHLSAPSRSGWALGWAIILVAHTLSFQH